jgi:hypothetical protein
MTNEMEEVGKTIINLGFLAASICQKIDNEVNAENIQDMTIRELTE